MPRYSVDRLQFLIGIAPTKLFRLLWRHRFRVARGSWRDVGQLFFISIFASLCNAQDRLFTGQKIRGTPLLPAPVFIVGHWRSGTTLMHKLMATDPALHAPTFFECCLPRGFISGATMIKGRIEAHLPKERPFDDAPFGIDEPFEDEFVLAKEALDSPMLEAVFPLSGRRYRPRFSQERLSPEEDRAWEGALLDFAQRLIYRHGKRLLFKSPAHSFRIMQLRSLFPGAKFIVLRRDATDVIASTLKMEVLLVQHNALQGRGSPVDEAWVVRRYAMLQESLQQALETLPQVDVTEVAYESLCRDVSGTIAAVYRQLQLPDSPARRDALAGYLASSGQLNPRRQDVEMSTRQRWVNELEAFGRG